MKTIFDHIEEVKGKPHHVRKQVAITFAALGSALIALVWLVGNVSLGTFAITGSSFASVGAAPVVATGAADGSEGVAGAAAALLPPAQTPAHIEIVDAVSTTSAKAKAEQTTIPF